MLHIVMASISCGQLDWETSDAQRTFLLTDVDEIEVGVVVFADDIMVEAEEEAVLE